MNSEKFAALAASDAVTGNKMKLRSTVAYALGAIAASDWALDDIKVNTKSPYAVTARASLMALGYSKQTANNAVKDGVNNAAKIGARYAGIVNNRQMYISEASLIQAVYLAAIADGVTTAANLVNLVKTGSLDKAEKVALIVDQDAIEAKALETAQGQAGQANPMGLDDEPGMIPMDVAEPETAPEWSAELFIAGLSMEQLKDVAKAISKAFSVQKQVAKIAA